MRYILTYYFSNLLVAGCDLAEKDSNKCPRFYNAIRKHESRNFKVFPIEIVRTETSDELEIELNEAEIYWIAECDSINKGYNIETGGFGGNRAFLDHDEVYELWKTSLGVRELRQFFRCDDINIRDILISKGETSESIQKRGRERGVGELCRRVVQICRNTGKILNIFDSIGEAARDIGCSHERRSRGKESVKKQVIQRNMDGSFQAHHESLGDASETAIGYRNGSNKIGEVCNKNEKPPTDTTGSGYDSITKS